MIGIERHLLSIGYVAAVGMGGGFVTKKIGLAAMWSWNYFASDGNKISVDKQETVGNICEFVGGIFFAFLAGRHIMAENVLIRQNQILKQNLHQLETKAGDLFKTIYKTGKDSILSLDLGF